MENEYQLQLGVKWLVQWQEQLDHKDRFGSGMAAIGTFRLFIPSCLIIVMRQLDSVAVSVAIEIEATLTL
jgi:hypothetical protein